jgi:hypothetical protein
MPVALERKLKRQVAGKKMSKERKDAYVYGTLRKTGWKPEREKKKELSAKLDKIIEFTAVPSYWAKGALKTGGYTVKGGTVRIPVLGNAGKKVPFRLSQLGSVAKEPAWWNKSTAPRYYPGPAKSHFSSKEKPIQFDASILGPWQGPSGHESKIDQLEFPAGLSPAAVLRMPFPKLMAYLNQRNLLQQQFSWKHERLIRLSAKLDEIHASAHPTQ